MARDLGAGGPRRRPPGDLGAGRPRRWPRRLLIGVNVFVAFCLVLTGAAYAYLKWQFGKIDKLTFQCDVLRNCGDDDPGQPMNVLLVGSDSRKGISAAERRQFGSEGQVGGQRSDTIIVLHVDPRAEKAAILSIPRDLAVPLAGSGSDEPRRINSAFEKGPEVLIGTIRQSLGIEIDHYAQVDFNGFRGVVEAIGGVTVYFPSPARDTVTGLNITEPGCVKLGGNEALAYVRSRNYQSFEAGKWRIDPTADLGRIERQQDFIRRVIGKASRVGRNPVRLNSLITNAVRNLEIDKAFSTKDMLRLARRFRTLEPDVVETLPLPTTQARSRRGEAVLKLKQPEAGEVLDRFTGRAPPPPAAGQAPPPPPKVRPGTVRVRVLNGSGSDGQAGVAAAALRQANFGVAGTGDADSFSYPRTVIRYGRGQQPKAQLLQAYVEGGARLAQDVTVQGVDLVLVTGKGFGGIRAGPGAAPPSSAAPTTAPAAPGKAPTGPAAPRGAPAQPAC